MSDGPDFNYEVFCSESYDNTTVEAGVCAAFDYVNETNAGLDTFFLLFAASFVFFMQTGFAVSFDLIQPDYFLE